MYEVSAAKVNITNIITIIIVQAIATAVEVSFEPRAPVKYKLIVIVVCSISL